jgi:glycopeptide antibiotics resistance protein
MNSYRKIITFLFVIYLLTVISLLVIPFTDLGMDEYIFGIRKDHYVHATMFLPFMGYFWITNKAQQSKIDFLKYYAVGILFAAFCESLHYFIPYREFDIHDFFANFTGISAGLIVFIFKSPKVFNQ